MYFIQSFIFCNRVVLVRDMVDLEPIMGTGHEAGIHTAWDDGVI